MARTTHIASLSLALTALAGTAHAQNVWPFAGTAVVARSFGSLENGGIHGGLDIPAARGTAVRAVCDGTISRVATDGTNPDVSDIYVTDAAGNEYYYGHVEKLAAAANDPAVGDAVTRGTAFCQVRRAGTPRSGSFGHIHFAYSTSAPGNPGIRLDPLRYVFPPNTVSESIVHHSLTLNPRDGKFPIFAQQNTPRPVGKFVKGDVDALAEISDDMGGTRFAGTTPDDATRRNTGIDLFKGYRGVPYEVSYNLDKPAALPRGDIAEQRLVRFDQTATNYGPALYDHPLRSIPAGDAGAPAGERGGNSDNYTFRVTAGLNGGTRFWNTNADKNAAGGVDGSGGGAVDTIKNADAQFPDGLYTFKPKGYTASSGNGGTGLQSVAMHYEVLVNNFKQVAAPARADGEAPANLFPESDETFGGPESTASPNPWENIFNLGENLYVKGAQFVDNMVYRAFVLPYQSVWNQGDSYSGALASTFVSSNSDGAVMGQLLWTSLPMQGDFNLAIDYDGDGKFSWTQDGIGSFHVVPTPGSLACLGLAAGLLARRRTRR